MAHRPETGRLEIQTNDEEQENNAQLGEVQQLFTICNEAGNRADNHACSQIAKDCSQPETFEQRRGNDRSGEDHQGLQIKTADGNIVFHN